jgi:hypothetical protein
MTAPGIHQVIVRGTRLLEWVLLRQLRHHFSYMAGAC